MNETSSRLAFVLLFVPAFALASCRSGASEGSGSQAETRSLAAPSPAAPSAALAPLAFMEGAWITADAEPGKAFSEELWMPPRGTSMAGVFRRVRGDGGPAFFEIVAITVESDGVLLRLRHFHGQLDPREGETDAMVLRLVEAGDGSATFDAVENTRGVARVTYAREASDAMVLRIFFEGDEQPELIRYARVR